MPFNLNQVYNLGQLRQICAQDCGNGIYNTTTGIWDYDQTTFPTLTRVNQMINSSIREICSYDFQCLEVMTSYPFFHVIENVQGVTLSGINNVGMSGTNSAGISIPYVSGTSVFGSITPYPSDVLQYSWDALNTVQDINSNYSGLAFAGVDISGNTWNSVSASGSISYLPWTGVGFTYQLNPDVDKLMDPPVWIAKTNNNLTAQGVFLQNIDFEDMLRMFPIGTVVASGTPQYVATSPGLSNSNNNGWSIVFGPSPVNAYSGNNFLVFHKKLHQDMINDTDVQSVITPTFQNVITALTEAKILQLIPGQEARTQAQAAYAANLLNNFKLWDWSQPSKARIFRDANYGSSSSGGGSPYDKGVWFRLGDMSH